MLGDVICGPADDNAWSAGFAIVGAVVAQITPRVEKVGCQLMLTSKSYLKATPVVFFTTFRYQSAKPPLQRGLYLGTYEPHYFFPFTPRF